MDCPAVLSELGADRARGLTADQVQALRGKYGPNQLPTQKPPSPLARFVDEYRSYLQVILLAAGIASLVIGQVATAVLLIVLTIINAIIGMIQAGRAANAMKALQSLTAEKVRVLRGGADTRVDPAEIVPGDIIPLTQGQRVPADGRIIEATSLQIDESALTGESTPASKQITPLTGAKDDLNPGDQVNMAFENTDVTHGEGVMVVTATGSSTQVGRIAHLLSSTAEEQPPLARQLNTMTLWIAIAAGVTMIVMFAVGFARGGSFDTLFDTAVALAIAAIPEALPSVVTVILSIGSLALAKRSAVVKNLASVETLGEVSAINSDKTGTLTMNEMTVIEIVEGSQRYQVSGRGYEPNGQVLRVAGRDMDLDSLILPFIIANEASIKNGSIIGDPLDGAFLILAEKAGLDPEHTRSEFPVLARIPFDPTYKLSAVFCRVTGSDGTDLIRAFVKGAVPALLDRSTTQEVQQEQSTLDDPARQAVRDVVTEMEDQGLRVMAGATADFPAAGFTPDTDLLEQLKSLRLGAVLGMIDPPRASAKDAVRRAREAHIQVRMVTGDDVRTGAAVAAQLGIPGKAISGAELSAMSDEQAIAAIEDIGVIARVAPADKERLVRITQRKGLVVAATGDGVNDAPALKAADIGVAMGTGTDVARESGNMILQDDDFSTIIYAVEQGRTLYDNLQKYVKFILITLVAFVLTFLGASLLNIAAGQPFTAVQILWINFLIDAPLGVVLGFDRETPGLMKRRPLPRGAFIITREVATTSVGAGILSAIAVLVSIAVTMSLTGSATLASTIALTTFGFLRIVASWQTRSIDSAISRSTFNNPQLNLVILAVFVLMVLETQVGFLRSLLGIMPLTIGQWLICAASGVALFLIWELAKIAQRARARRA